jgi:hypothetical protein
MQIAYVSTLSNISAKGTVQCETGAANHLIAGEMLY